MLILAGETEGRGVFYLFSLIPEVKHHQRTFLELTRSTYAATAAALNFVICLQGQQRGKESDDLQALPTQFHLV